MGRVLPIALVCSGELGLGSMCSAWVPTRAGLGGGKGAHTLPLSPQAHDFGAVWRGKDGGRQGWTELAVVCVSTSLYVLGEWVPHPGDMRLEKGGGLEGLVPSLRRGEGGSAEGLSWELGR